MTSLGKGTADQSHRDTGSSGGVAVLFRSQGGLPEMMLLKQRPAGVQQASPVDNGGKSMPHSENSKCKRPEAGGGGGCLAALRSSNDVSLFLDCEATFDHLAQPRLPGFSL